MVQGPNFDEDAAVAAMRKPRVIYLRYQIVPTDDEAEFRAPSFEVETDEFEIHVGPPGESVRGPFAAAGTELADGSSKLRIREELEALVKPKTRHPSEHAAHEAVRPILQAWEIAAALREPGKPPPFHLAFAGSLVLDEASPPGSDRRYAVSSQGSF